MAAPGKTIAHQRAIPNLLSIRPVSVHFFVKKVKIKWAQQKVRHLMQTILGPSPVSIDYTGALFSEFIDGLRIVLHVYIDPHEPGYAENIDKIDGQKGDEQAK